MDLLFRVTSLGLFLYYHLGGSFAEKSDNFLVGLIVSGIIYAFIFGLLGVLIQYLYRYFKKKH